MRTGLAASFGLALIVLPTTQVTAEQQVAVKYGYHFWESGQTYVGSDKNDREAMDASLISAEYTFWWGKFGLSITGDKNFKKSTEMFPGYYYKADLTAADLLAQYRYQYNKSVDLRCGFGINYSYLKNEYRNRKESLDGVGGTVSLGGDYWFDQWGLCLDAKYIRNDLASGMQNKTNYRVGGLKVSGGLKIRW